MPFSIAMTTAIAVRLAQTGIEIFYAATTAVWSRRAGGLQPVPQPTPPRADQAGEQRESA
jgi:hypothetical protein